MGIILFIYKKYMHITNKIAKYMLKNIFYL